MLNGTLLRVGAARAEPRFSDSNQLSTISGQLVSLPRCHHGIVASTDLPVLQRLEVWCKIARQKGSARARPGVIACCPSTRPLSGQQARIEPRKD